MFELITQYLKDNGINNLTLFSLGNDGEGSFIKTWGYEIEQPLFTQEEGLLQEAKDKKLTELLEARKAFQYKDITLNGTTYIATQTACTNLDGAISVLTDNSLTECNWLDANGNTSILTLTLAKQLRTAMFMQQSSSYMQEPAFKVEIEDCTTVEEVELLNITFS